MTQRFEIVHVRGREDLRELVKEYLDQYSGSFDYLLWAKNMHDKGYPMGDSVVKGVLNCMVSDPRVTNMPRPVLPPGFDASLAARSDDPFSPTLVGDAFSDGDRSWYPKVFRLKTKWRPTFGVSLRPQACLIHTIDTGASGLKLVVDRPGEQRFIWDLAWLCNPLLALASTNKDGNKYAGVYRLLTTQDAVGLVNGQAVHDARLQRKWKWCTKCEDES